MSSYFALVAADVLDGALRRRLELAGHWIAAGIFAVIQTAAVAVFARVDDSVSAVAQRVFLQRHKT